jgi:hypothetical protein
VTTSKIVAFPLLVKHVLSLAASHRWQDARDDTVTVTRTRPYRPSVLQYDSTPCAETCFRLHAAGYCDIIWGKGKFLVHIIQVSYSWSYITSALQTTSQLHVPAALPLVKEPPTRGEFRYALEPVWTFQGDILLHFPGIEARFLACPPSSLVTIPIELTRLLWHYLPYVHSIQGLFIQCYIMHHAVMGKMRTANWRMWWKQLRPTLRYPTSLR